MKTRSVWVCSVDFNLATALLDAGRGRPILQWDDRVWHYWHQLGWDQRPDSERDCQPPEVQAYAITPAEVRSLGVWLAEATPCVLFIFPAVQWAAIASDTRLVAEQPDFAPSAPDFVPPGVGRLT